MIWFRLLVEGMNYFVIGGKGEISNPAIPKVRDR
jgi:hypothetical protein